VETEKCDRRAADPPKSREKTRLSSLVFHPTADRLEALVEGNLVEAERVVVESHLVGCSRCQTEVEELRSLFSVLARMQHFSPSAAFMERVMAQVRLPDPWYVGATRFLPRFAPRTTRGWAFASAFFALPLIGFGAIMLWLLSKPYVTGEGLIAFTLNEAGARITAALTSVLSAMLHSDVTLFLARAMETLFSNGLRGAGALAVMFAGLTILSAWVLYQNLFRNPTRRSDYASYSF
jgi:anti-sigma factor RsiW